MWGAVDRDGGVVVTSAVVEEVDIIVIGENALGDCGFEGGEERRIDSSIVENRGCVCDVVFQLGCVGLPCSCQ